MTGEGRQAISKKRTTDVKRFFLACMCLALAAGATSAALAEAPSTPGHYSNFRVAVYVVVGATKRLADPALREREFERVMGQVKFDKVYLEVYRDRQFATDAEIESAKAFFESKGIEVSGGITLAAGGRGGQFGTFDYEDPADRAECQHAVELAAKHFNLVILDDFFFYTSKSDADIAAKGTRSWTQYRLDKMRDVAANLVLKPARTVNPNIKMIIKYPNWYEHFQGLGYDLEKESQLFDYIYTGTETRDPIVTDQLLQQYESYEIYRYFSNIRPGGDNRGGWVDTFSTLYTDRYAEELWDTMFAKAPEITLFSWAAMADPKAIAPGARDAWKNKPTSFNWDQMVKSYRKSGKDDPGPGWASVAGNALESVDKTIGLLGKPIGIPSYKPYQSSGEDFLQNYLGNIGLPIEMTPNFPAGADIMLLTESAKFDPDIVAKIKAQLVAGKSVVITSGLLRALQGKGIEDIVEWSDTGRVAGIHDFINGYGAGNGNSLNDPGHETPAILFPEIHFYTNDSWPIIRGVASAKGFPIMLMNRYSNGIIYLLTVPENIGDLYNFPQALTSQIKRYLQRDFPVRIEAPPQVALFAYDNNSFVVESYLPAETKVTVSVAGVGLQLHDLSRGTVVQATPEPVLSGDEEMRRRYQRYMEPPRTNFTITVEPHSYLAFGIENAVAQPLAAAPPPPAKKSRKHTKH
jgi:hypothetical protein